VPLTPHTYTLRKKPKFTPEGSNGDETTIHTTSEGDKYVDLGKKKRATVRTFKGLHSYPLPVLADSFLCRHHSPGYPRVL
jgi:hypothetical protein